MSFFIKWEEERVSLYRFGVQGRKAEGPATGGEKGHKVWDEPQCIHRAEAGGEDSRQAG